MHNTLYIADIRSNVNKGQSTGHFVPVARMYVDLFHDQTNVIVAGGPIYQKYFPEDQLFVLPHNVISTSLWGRWQMIQNAIALFKEGKGKTIVFQHSSIITTIIAIAFCYFCTSKLYLIQYSTEGVSNTAKRILYRLAKHKIDGIVCPNARIAQAYDRLSCIVPDYIYTGKEVKECTSFTDKEYDFCITGRIAPEKGVIEAARFFVKKNYRVLIAGNPQNETIKNELMDICKDARNITLRLGYISDDDYILSFRKSRYTILNYQEEYSERSSGVIYDTLFNGVPAIGRRCPALQFIENYGCGMLFEEIESFDPEAVLVKERYESYQEGIHLYKREHSVHKRKLMHFLQLG